MNFEEMKYSLDRFLRSWWLGVAILVAAAVLLAVAASDLGNRLPVLPVLNGASADRKDFPLARIDALLAADAFNDARLGTNTATAFFTRHFEPPPAPPPKPVPAAEPAPPPAPPPPTTRKAALLFQGVYGAAAGQKKAFIQVEGSLQALTNGARVIGDWSIAEISVRKLTLTNTASQTNILEFNAAKELEVPIK